MCRMPYCRVPVCVVCYCGQLCRVRPNHFLRTQTRGMLPCLELPGQPHFHTRPAHNECLHKGYWAPHWTHWAQLTHWAQWTLNTRRRLCEKSESDKLIGGAHLSTALLTSKTSDYAQIYFFVNISIHMCLEF